jgi:hypothetical protein
MASISAPPAWPPRMRRTIEHLRALVEAQQQQQIAEMTEPLARYEHPKRPAIY